MIKCILCGSKFDVYERRVLCKCGGLLEVELQCNTRVSWSLFKNRSFRLWRYRELIPLPSDVNIVSLCEGGTPLIRLTSSSEVLGVKNVFLKFEGANPTGSFKDRGMTVAISIAKHLGVKTVMCASTGNTSASMTAYAARAGLKPIIILPKRGIAKGKISQAILHGAEIVFVRGYFDDALRVVMEASLKGVAYPLNSINPWRIEGQKTVAYEIVEEIGVPDWIILPVGNAGNISAVWKGLTELRRLGLIDRLPRLAGVQASGAAPLVQAFKRGLEKPVFIDDPKTIASAIRIGKPVNWPRAMKALRESRGVMVDVSDEEIIEAQRLLARREGIGVEPASAAAIAGLKKLREAHYIDKDELIVVIATGHALKDPDQASSHPIRVHNATSINDAVEIIGKISSIYESSKT